MKIGALCGAVGYRVIGSVKHISIPLTLILPLKTGILAYSEDDLNKYKFILCIKTYKFTHIKLVAMTYFNFYNIWEYII